MKLTDPAEAPRPETRCRHVPVFSRSRSHTHHNELSKVIHPRSLAISLTAVHIEDDLSSSVCRLSFDALFCATFRSGSRRTPSLVEQSVLGLSSLRGVSTQFSNPNSSLISFNHIQTLDPQTPSPVGRRRLERRSRGR